MRDPIALRLGGLGLDVGEFFLFDQLCLEGLIELVIEISGQPLRHRLCPQPDPPILKLA